MIFTKLNMLVVALVLACGVVWYVLYTMLTIRVTPGTPQVSHVQYVQPQIGFTFTLPRDWAGFSVLTQTWVGTPLATSSPQTGLKLVVRHPLWREETPYEDLPILVFTRAQWDLYTHEAYSISAAPIMATELGRNSLYVLALPPRWNFDYALGFKEAEGIMVPGSFNFTAP